MNLKNIMLSKGKLMQKKKTMIPFICISRTEIIHGEKNCLWMDKDEE